jgi:hypothetical protein
MTVRTGRTAAAAQVPGPFGIIEAKGDGLLPVTVRNVEPCCRAREIANHALPPRAPPARARQ